MFIGLLVTTHNIGTLCTAELRDLVGMKPSPAATSATAARILEEPGTFPVRLDELMSRRYYEYRAVAKTNDGDLAVGSCSALNSGAEKNTSFIPA